MAGRARAGCSRRSPTRRANGSTGKGEQALGDWDISRDAPYFGIPIPDAPGQVLLRVAGCADRLSGRAARATSTAARRARNGEPRSFEEFLAAPDTEQIHFIGKDIIYFHTLFWPAMLKFAGPPYKVPDHVYVHGFITVSGEKMSKSRGTGISPLRYLDIGMNPEWLRYYIAAKLNANVEDLDFNPDDFVARVNSDLVGKYVNIASRAATSSPGISAARCSYSGDTARCAHAAPRSAAARCAQSYEAREFGKAMREIMALADRINQDFDARQPWVLAKDPAKAARAAGRLLARAVRLQAAVGAARAGAAGSWPRASRASCSASTAPFSWSDAAGAARARSIPTSTS